VTNSRLVLGTDLEQVLVDDAVRGSEEGEDVRDEVTLEVGGKRWGKKVVSAGRGRVS
jgi:hypothetical protein